jgi:6-phosphogluconolactonase
MDVRDGDKVRTVSAGLSVFRMNEDGRLSVARTYDIDVGDKSMWWVGMVPL